MILSQPIDYLVKVDRHGLSRKTQTVSYFKSLWFVEIFVKGSTLKLSLVKVLMKTVKDIVEDVKFIFTRWRDSVDVVEWH